MHGEGGGGGSFAVEVAGGGEVVERRFEGDFVVSSVKLRRKYNLGEGCLRWGRVLTLRSAVGLRGQEYSFHCQRAGPIFRWLRLFGGFGR